MDYPTNPDQSYVETPAPAAVVGGELISDSECLAWIANAPRVIESWRDEAIAQEEEPDHGLLAA